MAHYAFIDENNIVTEVIVGIDENELIDGLTPEQFYGQFRNQICLRTSYNNKIRGKYAGIGDLYFQDEDIFVTPQPFSSWTRNGSYWTPPIPYPNDDKFYYWDEQLGNWVNGETL
jgi:hypothetical protein